MTRYLTLLFVGSSVLLLVGFTSNTAPERPAQSQTSSMPSRPIQLMFLTRDGCANTPVLLENLKSATQSFDPNVDYEIVNQDTLEATDSRVGYATPTILFDNRDLFGLPEPVAPFPAPG